MKSAGFALVTNASGLSSRYRGSRAASHWRQSLHSYCVWTGHSDRRTTKVAIVDGMNVRDGRGHNYPPQWNAAPGQDLLVIRRNHQTGAVSLDPLRWGLIPYWSQDPKGGKKPINAKCETVRTLPMFRDAYRRRRCIVPVDGFFEWKAVKGQREPNSGMQSQ